jgi:hypothetical protein
MTTNNKALSQQRLTYVALSGLFLAILGAVSHLTRRNTKSLRLMDHLLLGLSTYRLGRMIAYDHVMEPFRAPFTRTVPDPSGAGDTVEPAGTGWRLAIGQLISCPICAGTWAAAALVYLLRLAPGPGRIFLSIMSAIGLGELLNTLTEMLSWTGQVGREQSGSYALARARDERKAV